MDKIEFEKVVKKALETLPEEFAKNLENMEITVEDAPGAGRFKNHILLGLYQGIPLEKRDNYYAGVLPDKITLFQKNIEAISPSQDEMIEQIQTTLLHELGHYFGISDKRLRGIDP